MKLIKSASTLTITILTIFSTMALADESNAIEVEGKNPFLDNLFTKNVGVSQSVDQNRNIYIITPLRETQVSENAEIRYQFAIAYAAKVVQEWAAKPYTASAGRQFDAQALAKLQSYTQKMNASTSDPEQYKKQLQSFTQLNDSSLMLEALDFQGRSMVSLNEQVKAFQLAIKALDVNQMDLATKEKGLMGRLKDLGAAASIPSAYMVVAAFRLPDSFKEFIGDIPKIGSKIKNFINGSMTISVTMVPWKVTVVKPNGKTTQFTYLQKVVQTWLNVDSSGQALKTENHFRFGVGLLFGPIGNLKTLNGTYVGASGDYNFIKKMTNNNDESAMRDFHTNIKFGVIISRDSVSDGTFIQNGYTMLSWQRGLSQTAEAESKSWRANFGYVFPLKSVTEFLSPPDVKSVVSDLIQQGPAAVAQPSH